MTAGEILMAAVPRPRESGLNKKSHRGASLRWVYPHKRGAQTMRIQRLTARPWVADAAVQVPQVAPK